MNFFMFLWLIALISKLIEIIIKTVCFIFKWTVLLLPRMVLGVFKIALLPFKLFM